MQDSVDALFMDYYNANRDLAIGICTSCHGIQNLRKDLKYLM